jgi:hypothetical protein
MRGFFESNATTIHLTQPKLKKALGSNRMPRGASLKLAKEERMKYTFLTVLLTLGVVFAQQTETTPTETTQMATTTETTRDATVNTDFVALSEEFNSIGTETYYLASVDNSGVEGHVQIAEVHEGGSKFVVTMNNTLPDYRYAVVLYKGDCGPDRPEVLRLGDINNSSGDPNTSITETDLAFDELTQGNYFMYIFAGEPGSQVLACGEVGVGANRMGM